ncbi:MAG: acetyl/propionyl/methylcrotonyl-CoA carboxylase subunit alpha [Ktedonobacteraceae bacterium]|nr:acetyl/propionyl/methylcrotonyl-CoA carboxylase subunit alpha [Ktedonobacteraceae bacterium]
MFKKVLIANRGEIAARIIATCRALGIRTVTIYSEVDSQSLHVREADEAYCIGPAPAAQSYLRGQAIIDTALESGAEAIHPGYGFLSENADFAEACAGAGLTFIGPPAHAIRLMGSKIAARQLALSVGAPIVPGYDGEDQSDTTLLSEAQRIGYPLLIKASAGGGGKGMRVVYSAGDFAEQLAGARREAQAAFGDATVFLERLILRPRHIEIQILGDQHGNLIHLGERECSIQRRHQKIVEESPSPALTPALRATMGEIAIRIARAAGYVNAGTLEFMLDEQQQFYFLEMNTRLQVEHPVTELVTGLDLVRHQLLIAAGEPLTLTQEQVTHRGHAIEVRLYAEDPALHFLPSTGTVEQFIWPAAPGIRVDSGIESGDEVTQYYDPMIAKLIAYGEDRPAAIERLRAALAQSVILGVTSNIPLLYAISRHPAFQAGQTHTAFLEEHNLLDASTFTPSELPSEVIIAAALYEMQNGQAGAALNGHTLNPWQTLGPWRMAGDTRTFNYYWQEESYTIGLAPQRAHTWRVKIQQRPIEEVISIATYDNIVLFRRGPDQVRAYIQRQAAEIQITLAGHVYRLQRRQPPNVAATAHEGAPGQIAAQRSLKAPMAGTIVKVQAHDGEEVQEHQVLVILSAMKMEHSITAPYAGKVRHIHYQEGAVVPGGAVLVEME